MSKGCRSAEPHFVPVMAPEGWSDLLFISDKNSQLIV
jgi:hypothetical protein